MNEYAVIIHHCDNDGYLSATELSIVAERKFDIPRQNQRFFCFNYNNTEELSVQFDDWMSMGIVDPESTVLLMGDISISAGNIPLFTRLCKMCKTTMWFDHHATSLATCETSEYLNYLPGVRSIEYCGAKLIWDFFPEVFKEFPSGEYVVNLVDDHDRFIHEMHGSRTFLSGTMAIEESSHPETSDFWLDCLKSKTHTMDIINMGFTIDKYKAQDEQRSRKSLMFEREFTIKDNQGRRKTLQMACINRSYNSDIFGEEYEKYPIVCCFTYNGKAWKYSLYSSRPDACCNKIAQAYSVGGGGHPGAAGFVRSENLFNRVNVVTPPINGNLNDYFGEYPVIDAR